MKTGRLTGFEYFLAQLSRITYALEQITNRCQFIFSFGGIHIVGNRDKPDVVIGEKFLRELSNLKGTPFFIQLLLGSSLVLLLFSFLSVYPLPGYSCAPAR